MSDDAVSYTKFDQHARGDPLSEAAACPPSVVADTIMRTIELGVTITDAAVDEKQTTIFCTPLARDPRCPGCGRDGRYRDTVVRPLTDLPVAGHPLILRVAVPRYRCRKLLVVLADRATRPPEVEDPSRAGQRDLRLHRDLPQPPTPPLGAEPPHPDRVRTILHQRHPHRRQLATTTGTQQVGQVNVSS